MDHRKILISAALLLPIATLIAGANIDIRQSQTPGDARPRFVPETWDYDKIKTLEIPLAYAPGSPMHVPSQYYYQIPPRAIYKSYPIYAPFKEPTGYMNSLKHVEPVIVPWNSSQFKSDADWIKAGEIIFNEPIAFNSTTSTWQITDPKWYEKTGVPLLKNGVMPFDRIVIRRMGFREVGNLSCASCHTRVMPDGTVIVGAQGNFPIDRSLAYKFHEEVTWPFNPAPGIRPEITSASTRIEEYRAYETFISGTPYLKPDPHAGIRQMTGDALAAAHQAIPPGVMARHRASVLYPVQVPDLIGVRSRKYLDHTGLIRQRSIGDLMRYVALNQGGDYLADFGGFVPLEAFTGQFPAPPDFQVGGRYTDDQLYALAMYLYSLQPPKNPNKPGTLTQHGQTVFASEGCASCHTPPLYTNNKLMPVDGFRVPKKHLSLYDILPFSVGTDPSLALKTRRGTGYYKVPSLKGVWYRGPFEHSGSVATLEDWFDPNRLLSDYVPTGFIGANIKHRAVKGHQFGLDLSAYDKKKSDRISEDTIAACGRRRAGGLSGISVSLRPHRDEID